jgi:hypothetical protein
MRHTPAGKVLSPDFGVDWGPRCKPWAGAGGEPCAPRGEPAAALSAPSVPHRTSLTAHARPRRRAREPGSLRLPHALGARARRDGATRYLAPAGRGGAADNTVAEHLLSSGRGDAPGTQANFGGAREGMEGPAAPPGPASPGASSVPTESAPHWPGLHPHARGLREPRNSSFAEAALAWDFVPGRLASPEAGSAPTKEC